MIWKWKELILHTINYKNTQEQPFRPVRIDLSLLHLAGTKQQLYDFFPYDLSVSMKQQYLVSIYQWIR